MNLEILELGKPAMSQWTKRFVNPRRLACTRDPYQADRVVQSLLRAADLANGARGPQRFADEMLAFILETAFGSQGALIRFPAHQAPAVISKHVHDAEPLRLDRTILEYVSSRGLAIGSVRQDDHGDWPVACVPIVLRQGGRVEACVYLERRLGDDRFTTAELERIYLVARGLGKTIPSLSTTRTHRRLARPQREAALRPAPEPTPQRDASRVQTLTRFDVETASDPDAASTPERRQSVPLTMGLLFQDGAPFPGFLEDDS